MSAAPILLALLAAALHAIWNALLRSSNDRLLTATVMTFGMVPVALPLAIVLPIPPAALPLLVSASLQVGYSFFLVGAYKYGDLGQVYPLVRGSVPLLITMTGLLMGDQIDWMSLTGIGLVAVGVISLSTGKSGANSRSVAFALGTAVLVASYTTIDSFAVRSVGDPLSYATWICLVYGTLLPTAFLAVRGRAGLTFGWMDARKALVGGVASMVAYGAIIAAFALGPAGPVTALRETSVVFAAGIGWIFLGESPSRKRVLSCLLVAAGAMALGITLADG